MSDSLKPNNGLLEITKSIQVPQFWGKPKSRVGAIHELPLLWISTIFLISFVGNKLSTLLE
jgi:hypothetical protein